MESARMERKLAAILCADVAGFSRLMREDETATLATLNSHRAEILDPEIARHGGRIFKALGDDVLAEFASVVDALKCAVAIHERLRGRNAVEPAHRRLEFRIGINLGDVIVQDGDVFGDGVNIAARLQSVAAPGAIVISSDVHRHVETKLPLHYHDLGDRKIKEHDLPVHAYRVTSFPSPADSIPAAPKTGSRRRWRALAAAILGILIFGGAAWIRYFGDSGTIGETACLDHLGLPVPAKECTEGNN